MDFDVNQCCRPEKLGKGETIWLKSICNAGQWIGFVDASNLSMLRADEFVKETGICLYNGPVIHCVKPIVKNPSVSVLGILKSGLAKYPRFT
jgi:hypothetical protein